MKFMMLLHSNPEAFASQTPEQMQAAMEFFDELYRETTASGELVDTAGLAHPSQVRTVRHRQGTTVATDGPFAESKEVMASYAIYDLESSERAMDLANRVAVATGGTVEVWPVMDFGGTDV